MSAPFEYIFYPSTYTPPLGHSRLDICLAALPTQRFFDVVSVRLPVMSDGRLEVERVVHHGAAPQSQTIFPGRIILEAHNGDRAEAFSFGGEMALETHDDYTIARIRSSAPIFSLGDGVLAPVRLMTDEILALLAKEQARRQDSDEAFWNRLAHLAPYRLFIVLLHTLQTNAATGQWAKTPEAGIIPATVQHAIAIVTAADGWPAAVPTLAETLQEKTS